MASLLPEEGRASARAGFHPVALGDRSLRGVAEKLLGRPDLLEAIRHRIGGHPALLEPWNVTGAEARLALELGVPVSGSGPDLWPLGFKGAGRQLFRGCGVPLPAGREGITEIEEALDAILSMRAEDPALARVILKHDDSAAGDGNRVVDLSDAPSEATLRRRLDALGAAYWEEMAKGGIVEEMLHGDRFTSSSVQVGILPDGTGVVLLMLSGLALDGRFGMVALGRDGEEAQRLFGAVPGALR